MNTISRRFAALFALACLGGALAADVHPTPEHLVHLAAISSDYYDCTNNPYCIVQQGDILPESDGNGAHWTEANYTAELDVWWSRDRRGLMLLDFHYRPQAGCGEFPCGVHDVYVSRYGRGEVRDEKFSRIGVPSREAPWWQVKPMLPAAVRADAEARIRRAQGLMQLSEGEPLLLDIKLPRQGTDITVYVMGGGASFPLYRLKWDAARGMFVSAKL